MGNPVSVLIVGAKSLIFILLTGLIKLSRQAQVKYILPPLIMRVPVKDMTSSCPER